MKITDEILSAFLDNELSDAEMAEVRGQLAEHPALTDRLAELASVDAELQTHYGSIDDRPMPESVIRMLEVSPPSGSEPSGDNVVIFPWWRRMRGHAGKAIAAAVILGVVLVQWMVPSYQGGPAWPAVANVLDKQPSGEGYQVTSDTTLTPRLTFRSQSGDWCRQFRLDTANSAYEQIACRNKAGDWEQIARVAAESSPGKATYKAASGGNVLDDTLDQMMAGAPIGPDEERALLAHQWKGR